MHRLHRESGQFSHERRYRYNAAARGRGDVFVVEV